MRYYQGYCEDALDDFCALFWPCEFENRAGRCVNVREAHSKGHQNEKGKIINAGDYVSRFSFEGYREKWLMSVLQMIKPLQDRLARRLLPQSKIKEKDEVTVQHGGILQGFYQILGDATNFISHSTCFCCLREMPEHPLPCGHVLCTPCAQASWIPPEGKERVQEKHLLKMNHCPLHLSYKFTSPWMLKFKPDLAGVRILSLDG